MFLLPRAAPLFLYQSMRKQGRNQLPQTQIAHKGSTAEPSCFLLPALLSI